MNKVTIITDMMKMPKNCLRCQFLAKNIDRTYCRMSALLGKEDRLLNWEDLDERAKSCPLKELPEGLCPVDSGYKMGYFEKKKGKILKWLRSEADKHLGGKE